MIKVSKKEALRVFAVIAKQNDVHICIFRSYRKIVSCRLRSIVVTSEWPVLLNHIQWLIPTLIMRRVVQN